MNSPDMLALVAKELKNRRGQWADISDTTGVGYDTVLRIRDGDPHDPGYSKVKRLYDYLFPSEPAKPKRKPAKV